jgi:hypothetical protein
MIWEYEYEILKYEFLTNRLKLILVKVRLFREHFQVNVSDLISIVIFRNVWTYFGKINTFLNWNRFLLTAHHEWAFDRAISCQSGLIHSWGPYIFSLQCLNRPISWLHRTPISRARPRKTGAGPRAPIRLDALRRPIYFSPSSYLLGPPASCIRHSFPARGPEKRSPVRARVADDWTEKKP